MDTNIYKQGRFTKVKPTDPVQTTRNMRAFAVANNLRDCIMRGQGGWYKIGLDGICTFAFRTLQLVSFEDLYKIMKD